MLQARRQQTLSSWVQFLSAVTSELTYQKLPFFSLIFFFGDVVIYLESVRAPLGLIIACNGVNSPETLWPNKEIQLQ